MFSCHDLTLKGNESLEHFKGKILLCQKFLKPKFGHEPHLILIEEYPRRKKGRSDIVLYNVNSNRIEVWVEIQETPLDKSQWKTKINTAFEIGDKEMLYVVGLTHRAMKTIENLKEALKCQKLRYRIFSLDILNWQISEVDI